MSSKDVIERAYGHIPKEIGMPFSIEIMPNIRGIRFYWLKLIRFFTR
jgi:hypothetical protein